MQGSDKYGFLRSGGLGAFLVINRTSKDAQSASTQDVSTPALTPSGEPLNKTQPITEEVNP